MRKRNTCVINENMDVMFLVSQVHRLHLQEADRIMDVIMNRSKPSNVPGYEDWRRQFHNSPSKLMAKFWAITQVAPECFAGVDWRAEVLCEGGYTSPQKMDGSDIVFEYLNVGDTYSPTIGYDHRIREWVVTSWGDLVEKKYRRLLADREGR